MIQYYQEATGDFLAIDTATNRYYLRNLGEDLWEGRATAIAGQVGSVCTTSVSGDFLKAKCKRVAQAEVPAKWLKAIGY